MNTQRWITLGVLALAIVCLATTNLWLTPLLEDDEQQAEATPTATLLAPEAGGADGGAAGLTLTPEPTVNPVVAEILAELAMEDLGPGLDPHIILAGDFVTIDAAHQGQGTASIWWINETQRVLRLDAFSVTSGPDLIVVLSQHEAPRTSAEALLPTYVAIGELKADSGAQNYDIPPGTQVEDYRSVVIYSMSLNIVYSTATLQEVRAR
jgi:hypothetical protein